MSEKLHKTYQKLLKRQPFGNALYKPAMGSEMYPGCVGFFTDQGDWTNFNWDIWSTDRAFEPIQKESLGIKSRPWGLDVVHSENVSQVQVTAGVSLK
jgi:hypothetical protein